MKAVAMSPVAVVKVIAGIDRSAAGAVRAIVLGDGNAGQQ
jgi:hypothetical protein